MDERRLSSFLVKSGIAGKGQAESIVCKMKTLLADKAALEAPFGPFVGPERATLQEIAKKTGKPEFFLAFMNAMCDDIGFSRIALGDAARRADFLTSLDVSCSRANALKGQDGAPLPLSDATIITKVRLACVQAVDRYGLA